MKHDKTEKIISALLTKPTVKEAAKNLKIAESTLYNYLKDRDFKAKYNEAKSMILSQTALYLQSNASKSANNIIKLMENEQIPPAVRLNACKAAIEYSIKLTEIADILPRIEQLEQSVY